MAISVEKRNLGVKNTIDTSPGHKLVVSHFGLTQSTRSTGQKGKTNLSPALVESISTVKQNL